MSPAPGGPRRPGAARGTPATRGRGAAPRPGPGRPKPAARKRAPRRTASFHFRFKAGRLVMLGALGLALLQLIWIQGVQAPQLSAESASQRTTTLVLPAMRGTIEDASGKPLAYTLEAKALTFQPIRVRKELQAAWEKSQQDKSQQAQNTAATAQPVVPKPEDRIKEIAKGIHDVLGDAAPEQDLLDKMNSKTTFVYLVRNVDPAKATQITDKFDEVGAERQDIREYPGGSLAANIVGATGWDGHGLIGMESSMDSTLAGTNGSRTYDRGSDGAVIPGSVRDVQPAINGSTVQLTIDSDLQYYVQQQVQEAKNKSGAKDVSAVVMDSKTGEVMAMANDDTFNPANGLADISNKGAELGDLPVTTPFEPGSVNKIVTAAAAIQYGVTTPEEVLQVPGEYYMDGLKIHDDWSHGVAPYTTTGVFAKSSNIGTLMLAKRVGMQRYDDLLKKFGIGERTGIGLPGESAGYVPPFDQWQHGTFANVPIGQGLSMTLLQMTGMYQAIANNGLRIPPRIVKDVIAPDGSKTTPPAPEGVQVVSPQTATTVRDMFRSIVQNDGWNQRGTGVAAAVTGYQIAGKTGTAQQFNQACHCYYQSKYWINFAGIAPADNPRFVVGIMMDAPDRSSDGSGGQSAAPLFHNIAAWLLQRDQVPLSPPAPKMLLEAD
ncbi:peptidoglycan D,D-transpeptidase FtsI family protein [Speluncibacter jeojiensis]|uniref:peptidoglycan D,D-transpeptidase FtsI family protein n=1 Tax=Speluncibacter jeojiensis TaxID=2710754 RepID=UPI00240F0628|nr:penicillin-binding protein 2 [Rhodococcus sp. D2-41]